jgi:hypothetical protein
MEIFLKKCIRKYLFKGKKGRLGGRKKRQEVEKEKLFETSVRT